ncbi:glycosyltransferase family 2 protein [Priestia aryabhattai]|uniref:glycosyltransferase family 2 protein n=1 Tax=Priestia aryabhattai TaxID=412384 RepID=UPI001CD62428|nr:glycosyltransferase family 2 protein [Priestia aryabhattai]MCA1048631.1 glycosyltransferase family 2 protein [Priestia aryabhattai]
MNELVSIVTPMFNSEKYIRDAINSVINQEYQNWEMIIVDDASKDESQEIVRKFVLEDKRIKLITQEKNSGVVAARNRGISESQGRYLAFLDSDDMWHPKKLSMQIELMNRQDVAFCFSSYEIMQDNGQLSGKIIKVPRTVNYNQLLRGNIIGCLTVLIDRKKISSIKMPNIRHEDYATWLTILSTHNLAAHGLSISLAYYRRAENSLSSNKLKTIRWSWDIFRKHLNMGNLESSYRMAIFIINVAKKYLFASIIKA